MSSPCIERDPSYDHLHLHLVSVRRISGGTVCVKRVTNGTDMFVSYAS